jgi:hypothetical protein
MSQRCPNRVALMARGGPATRKSRRGEESGDPWFFAGRRAV